MRSRVEPSPKSFRPTPPGGPSRLVAALLVAAGVGGCVDLNVTNINEPDAERALANPADVASLIAGSYFSWFNGVHYAQNWSVATPGFFLSNMAFQHAAPWGNFSMNWLGNIPRKAIENYKAAPQSVHGNISWAWENTYRALSSVANGLKALEDPEVAGAFSADSLALLKSYVRFVQGLGHGTIALLYARGFVLDEETDLEEPQIPVGYDVLMQAAHGYLGEAIALAGSGSFQVPFDWMQAELDAQGLARLAHSMRARFRAQVARTPEERAAVDWGAVMADVDAGIQSTHEIYCNWPEGWDCFFLWIATRDGWGGWLPYFIHGMADQSGNVAQWHQDPIASKSPLLPDGSPVLIVTPDLRFPQGTTVEEQRANEGRFFRLVPNDNTWTQADRGTWRWSWYRAGFGRGLDYGLLDQRDQPEVTVEEMDLLKAEALFRMGDLAGAALIVNKTRVPAGLTPTDAAGTNESCLPRLPDGSCGGLWEMLKWEKRMETVWTGIAGANWFLDGRGWGDLWKDTPLHLPIPCGELEILGLLPCRDVGGPGGEMGSPGSVYQFPWEDGTPPSARGGRP